MNTITSGVMTIQRAQVLDAIKALLWSSKTQAEISPADSYSLAYQNGYEAALMAVALVIGEGDELKREVRR